MRPPVLSPALQRLTRGPGPAWPAPVESLAEGWARLPPRVRLLVVLGLVLAVAAGTHLRVQAAEHRWGGEPVAVLVAGEPAAVGDPAAPAVHLERRPPTTVPGDAVAEVDAEATLALALPRGAVLTRSHLDPGGPAAGLPEGLRAVPVEIDAGWGVASGSFVDVWADAAATPVATGRPVLEVRDDARQPTALVGLATDEVAAMAGAEQVRLTHAPAPGPTAAQPTTGSDDE